MTTHDRAMMDSRPHTILKALIGSQAHGLAGPESDADYRSVYAIPTEQMFRIGFKSPGTKMAKGLEDETSWEVGPFLALAVNCHPLILETLVAPVIAADSWGDELRSLLPAIWSPQRAYEAYTGYAANQRRKFLDKKDARPAKYAVAYLRTLYNLCELLEFGTLTMRVIDTPIGRTLADIRGGTVRAGEIIDLAEYWTAECTKRLTACRHQPDPKAVDEFLIRLRKSFLH
jgi:hypothetical protein